MVRAPEETVLELRDELYRRLVPITPDAPDWETYRAWHLLGHLSSLAGGEKLTAYSDEVKAAREIRDTLKVKENPQLLKRSKRAENILHSNQLDGRSISKDFTLESKVQYLNGIIGVLLMIGASPLSIPSTGLQALIARYLGDNTDEGVDARTTYHMFAGFFSPLTIWPLVGGIIAYQVLEGSVDGAEFLLSFVIFVFLISTIFHFSNLVMLRGYDLVTDFRMSLRRRRLAHSEDGELLNNLINSIVPELVALK